MTSPVTPLIAIVDNLLGALRDTEVEPQGVSTVCRSTFAFFGPDWASVLGIVAHTFIACDYQERLHLERGKSLFVDDSFAGPKPFGEYLIARNPSLSAANKQKIRDHAGSRPDLVLDLRQDGLRPGEPAELEEIKPNNPEAIREGREQIGRVLAFTNSVGLTYRLGTTYAPPARIPVLSFKLSSGIDVDFHLSVTRCEPGLIVYQYCIASDWDALKRILKRAFTAIVAIVLVLIAWLLKRGGVPIPELPPITGIPVEVPPIRVPERVSLRVATDPAPFELDVAFGPMANQVVAQVEPDEFTGLTLDVPSLSGLFANDPRLLASEVSGERRAFGGPSDLSATTRLAVRGLNLPSTAALRWNIPASEQGRYTISQAIRADGAAEVTIQGIRPGRTMIDVLATDGGTTLASARFPLSVPQFIVADDMNPAFDAFLATTGLGEHATRQEILAESRRVIAQLVQTNANVRLLWRSTGSVPPPFVPAAMLTSLSILNADPSPETRYGKTIRRTNPDVPMADSEFGALIHIYPATYLVEIDSSHTNMATNRLFRAILSLPMSDPQLRAWVVRMLGRLLGETMSHEIFHSLLPLGFHHNAGENGDLMDEGFFRGFHQRTGIRPPPAQSFATAQELLQTLVDDGIGAIDRLGNVGSNPPEFRANLQFIQERFTVAPTPPFN